MAPYDFDTQLSQGHTGEAEVIEFFKHLDPDKFVVDVTDDSVMQRRGIDFIWMSRGCIGEFVNYEVKTDSYPAQNFFFETEVNGKPGWVDTCCADAVVYYFQKEGYAYILPMPELRAWLREHMMGHVHQDPKIYKEIISTRNNYRWATYGVAMPVYKVLATMEGVELVQIRK
jgi:hypothetical protein